MDRDTGLGILAFLLLLFALVVVPIYWVKRRIQECRTIVAWELRKRKKEYLFGLRGLLTLSRILYFERSDIFSYFLIRKGTARLSKMLQRSQKSCLCHFQEEIKIQSSNRITWSVVVRISEICCISYHQCGNMSFPEGGMV